jgi:hypothetical protein
MGPHCGGDTPESQGDPKEIPRRSQGNRKETPGKSQGNPMTGISGFVQQSHNFIAVW